MEIFKARFSFQSYFDNLAEADHSLLMLDYDGTLSPFTPERDHAVPYSGVSSVIDQIAKCAGSRIVIISGRSVSDVKKLLAVTADIEIWGSHGAERYEPGKGICTKELDPDTRAGLETIDQWAEKNDLVHSLEKKPVARAFHWRGETDDRASQIRKKVMEHWRRRITRHKLFLHEFNGGIELRPVGISKASAVTRLLAESDGQLMAAYLGDDQTDEDAFLALGSRGLKVLVLDKKRSTRADLRLVPPDELLTFLRNWHEAVSRKVGSKSGR